MTAYQKYVIIVLDIHLLDNKHPDRAVIIFLFVLRTSRKRQQIPLANVSNNSANFKYMTRFQPAHLMLSLQSTFWNSVYRIYSRECHNCILKAAVCSKPCLLSGRKVVLFSANRKQKLELCRVLACLCLGYCYDSSDSLYPELFQQCHDFLSTRTLSF